MLVELELALYLDLDMELPPPQRLLSLFLPMGYYRHGTLFGIIIGIGTGSRGIGN